MTSSTPHLEHSAIRSHGGTGRVVAWLLGLVIVALLAASAGPDGAWAASATNAATATDTPPPAVVETGGDADESPMPPCPRGDCDDAGADCSPGCTASCSAACGIAVVILGTERSVSLSDAFTLPRGGSLAVPPVTRPLRPPIA